MAGIVVAGCPQQSSTFGGQNNNSNQSIHKIITNPLLNTAAIGALCIATGFPIYLQPAHAQSVAGQPVESGDPQCSVSGSIATCTGDLASGVLIKDDVLDTLNVNNIDGPITPSFRNAGITFIKKKTGDVTINSDISSGGINAEAEGILAVIYGDGQIDITNKGDITAGEEGIYSDIYGNGNITIDNTGNITSNYGGIFSYVEHDGDITINQTGNILAQKPRMVFPEGTVIDDDFSVSGGYGYYDAYGIEATTGSGNISINMDGNITSTVDAIRASAGYFDDGNIDINFNGDIESEYGAGIVAYANNDIMINTSGNINSHYDAIVAISMLGNININNSSILTSEYGSGISVGLLNSFGRFPDNSDTGYYEPSPFITNIVNIANSGDISAENGAGIIVTGIGNNGILTGAMNGPSSNGGMFLENTVNIANTGDIVAGEHGIAVGTFSFFDNQQTLGQNAGMEPFTFFSPGLFDANDVTILNTGDITSDGAGIFVGSYIERGDFRLLETLPNNIGQPSPFASGTFFDSSVNIQNSGDITAKDDNGIAVGVININNNNDLLSFSANNSFADGGLPIGSSTFGQNDIVINNSGDINVTNGNGIFVGISNENTTPDLWPFNVSDMGIIEGRKFQAPQSAIFGGNDINILNTGKIDVQNGNGITVGIQNSFNQPGSFPKAIGKTQFSHNKLRYGAANIFDNNTVNITNTGKINVSNGDGIFVGTDDNNNILRGLPTKTRPTNGADPIFNPGLFDGNEINIVNTGDITVANGNGIHVSLNNANTLPGNRISKPAAVASAEQSDDVINIINTGDITAINGSAIVVERNEVPTALPGLGTSLSSADLANALPTSTTGVTITNSGKLSGSNGFAITLQGDGNDVVNLLAGTVINGAIDFGNGNNNNGGANPNDIDTLNIGPGVNLTVDFADLLGGDTDLQSAPENINFAGAGVLINNGLTAVAVDPNGFSGQGRFISDITDAIFNTVDNGGTAFENGGSTDTQAFGPAENEGSDDGIRLWGSIFGGHSDNSATNSFEQFDHDFFGVVSGIELGDANVDGAFGVLGGYSNSNLSPSAGTGGVDIDTFFGGLYWKQDFISHRIHAAFVAGATDNEATRTVNGVQAKGDFDGTFYSPSLTVSAPLDVFASPTFVSARANYVFMDLDEYTETGIALPLTIGDRDVSLFNVRGQFIVPQSTELSNGDTSQFNWTVGVDATIDAGSDDVTALVAATPFSFEVTAEDNVAGFVGINYIQTAADGMSTIGFNGELQSDFDGGMEATGELKASLKF